MEEPDEGGQPVNDALVAQAISDLLDDLERQGHLTQDQVERLIDKRHLPLRDSLRVYSALAEKGVELVLPEADELRGESEEGASDIDTDTVRVFLNSAYKHRILTREQEAKLGRAIRLGKEAEEQLRSGELSDSVEARARIRRGLVARERMIKCNLRLVVSVARDYKHRSTLDFLDIVQEGMFGLMRAVDKFDYSFGTKFSTYAVWWIRQSIFRAFDDKGNEIRVPVHMMERVRRYRRAARMLNVAGGAGTRQIAQQLGWSDEYTLLVAGISQLQPISLDAPIGHDDDDTSRIDLARSTAPGPDSIYDEAELSRLVEAVLRSLPEKLSDILRKRFGLDGTFKERTLEEIGNEYGVTRERIRQLEAKALKILRHPSRSRRLRTMLF